MQLVQGKCPRPTRVFRQMPGAFRGLPGVRGLPGPPSSNLATSLQSFQVGPADQNSPPSRIRRLEETGSLEPNPKPNFLLVATGSRLDSLQAKSLEPGPTKHCTRLVYTGRRNKKEDRSASSSSGGNRGPRANPKSKPCARLVGTGATSSRQVSSQNFICRKLGPRAKPKAKPSARLVWQVQLVHALIASKLKASSQT